MGEGGQKWDKNGPFKRKREIIFSFTVFYLPLHAFSREDQEVYTLTLKLKCYGS